MQLFTFYFIYIVMQKLRKQKLLLTKFTFYFIYIVIREQPMLLETSTIFTFYFIYIVMILDLLILCLQKNLHSTLFILLS